MLLAIKLLKHGLQYLKTSVLSTMSNQFYFVLCSVNILNNNNNNNMASYSFKFEENTDLRQFSLSTEKEYGVQCVIL